MFFVSRSNRTTKQRLKDYLRLPSLRRSSSNESKNERTTLKQLSVESANDKKSCEENKSTISVSAINDAPPPKLLPKLPGDTKTSSSLNSDSKYFHKNKLNDKINLKNIINTSHVTYDAESSDKSGAFKSLNDNSGKRSSLAVSSFNESAQV